MITTPAKPTILIQLDPDPQPSVFDGVVAVDAGVAHLFRHGGVTPERVKDLIFGAIFTRGPADLKSTALFVGGSDVQAGEAILKAATSTFFGPFRVSVLFDANGSNTTAAAAVLAALKGFGGDVAGRKAAVLGGTGPVGQRVARLLARLGADVSVGSRKLDKAAEVAGKLSEVTGKTLAPFETASPDGLAQSLAGTELIVAAGTTGVTLLPKPIRLALSGLKVAIDLNAVPPLGIEGIEAIDKAVDRDGVAAWGALGVGGLKMKIHRAAIQALFERNDQVFDAEEVLEIGRGLGL